MKQIKVGIIGQGRSGHDIHAHTLVTLLRDHFTVVAVADPRPGQLASDTLGKDCDRLADYREILKRKDVDLVVNASPSHLHVPITIEALEAGFNVLCEKPFARTVAEVDRVIDTARRTGRLVAIFQQSRFSPSFIQVKSVMDSGVLGRVVQVKISYNGFARRWDWQTLDECNGGSLRNTGPHPVDQALQLFGMEVWPKVVCYMDRANSFGDAEDFVKVILSGPYRPTIEVEISSCSAYSPYGWVVNGTRGSLAGTTEHLEWKFFREEEAPRQVLTREPLPGRGWCSEDLKWHTGSWDFPTSGPGLFDTMARSFYLALYDSIQNGKPLVVKHEEVRRQISIMEECHKQYPRPQIRA